MDGAGKSTQLTMLADWLRARGETVLACRDPGGTSVGDEIRRLLLDPASTISPRTEMLLYMASRSQLVDEVILPALDAGSIVLCDRFLLSTIVYQGYAGAMDPERVRELGLAATGGLWPDWTGVLDLPPEAAARRRIGPADRIERRSIDYHRRVREGFLAEAKRDPDRIVVWNAMQSVQAIHEAIRNDLESRFFH